MNIPITFKDAITPNSLSNLLLVKMKVANPLAVVKFVINVALPILTITLSSDFI